MKKEIVVQAAWTHVISLLLLEIFLGELNFQLPREAEEQKSFCQDHPQ